jgi:radical SAM superfamily enzyme YgiQ (UPF0313 family)
MSNLGFHYIYRVLREMGVAVERFFASPSPYRSVERDTMIERFRLILASVAYEPGVLELARWLDGAGVPPSRHDRSGALVGAGGAMTYINPLPLSSICDFVTLGDGVSVTRFIVETVRRGLSREGTLSALAEHRSIYVPSVHGDGLHTLLSARDDVERDYGRGTWTTPLSAFGDTLLVELQRGCARGCSYCSLTSCFAPVRTRGVDLVKRDLAEADGLCGFSRVGLVTPEASDYAALDELLDFAEDMGKGISFASLRAERLTERMVRAVTRFGRAGVTIAPESGDDSLRERCGKRFTNHELVEKLKMAADCGARSAKMYFMFGLPGETDEHLLSIFKLCALARDETGLRITASVSPFVPKPGTPWAGEVFDGEKKLRTKHAVITRSFRAPGIKLQCAGIKEACVEHAVSWAGRLASELIPEAALSRAAYRHLGELADYKAVYAELGRLGLAPRGLKGGA